MVNFIVFFLANTFFLKILFFSSCLYSLSFLKSSFLVLLLKISPAAPFNKNSLGPFLQSLAIIVVLHNADSIITNPGSSHSDVKTKNNAFVFTSRGGIGQRRQDCCGIREARGLERAGHPATQNVATVYESSNAHKPSASAKHATTKSRRLSVEQQNEDDDGSK